MWQFLLAAAVAGSTGFATKHFLTPKNTNDDPNASSFHDSESGSASRTHDGNGVFTFSSSKSPIQDECCSWPRKHGGSNSGVRVPKDKAVQRHDTEVRSEQRKGGRKLHFCLKKRKTNKNVAARVPFGSSKDNSSFGWGLSFGIMYMMSAGKAEINKLNKNMDDTAKLVEELKSELNKTKSSCAHKMMDSGGNVDTKSLVKSGRHDVMLKKQNSRLRDSDFKIWTPTTVNDYGESGSSTLTEEPEPRVLEMDQLEAELEFELQKLSGDTIDSPRREEIQPKFDELEAPYEPNFNHSKSQGVSPSELNQKLSHLLMKQQESQIMELDSKLQQAQSNLQEKEAELRALKDCVRRLTELSLSTVSDDEAQVLTDTKGTSDLGDINMDSESKQSVVGTKRPIDSESCSCYI